MNLLTEVASARYDRQRAVREEATVDRLFPASVRFEGQIATTGYGPVRDPRCADGNVRSRAEQSFIAAMRQTEPDPTRSLDDPQCGRLKPQEQTLTE